ncbi:MAG: UV damage repair endonuclease UvsE [Desulfobacterales bacterium]|nr:MAG: UV damage repair endonuclease UvsE [Desulfobacterales bacterium]
MIRFGLCCIFKEHPVKFRRTTAKYLEKFPREVQKQRLAEICTDNARSLLAALRFCKDNQIGSFRINSQILPLKTHPAVGYDLGSLPNGAGIIRAYEDCGAFSRAHNIRTTFHPDQFVVLSSPNPEVVQKSIADLEYQAQVAQWVNADVINIHAGGVYNDKPSALARLKETIASLPDAVRQRLTLENDDKSYTPSDLLPLCHELNIPLVYDVHHHRCLPDGLSVADATEQAIETWNREPLFHISSPKDGWGAKDLKKHDDYIDINDLPQNWLALDLTIEVEAKAKELAVRKLMRETAG